MEGATAQHHPCLGNLIYSLGKMKNKHDFDTINLIRESYSIIFCNSLEISNLNNLKSLKV